MRLPPTRDLARQHRLSRGTVINAFELLRAEGYVKGTVGSGTYVSKQIPEDFLQARADGRTVHDPQISPRLSEYSKRARFSLGNEARPVRAFRANIPAVDLFPTGVWARVVANRLRRASMSLLLGCEPFGYAALRIGIQDHLNAVRGMRCTAEQVVIVSGVQEALDLASRLLVNPGERVAVESPGYPGATKLFASAGATVVPISVDAEGLIIDTVRLRRSRLVYVTPAHQFPLGITMTLARRVALLKWARTNGAAIFEDDYDSEFRYSGPPIPALHGLDPDGAVLMAGSFNKMLFPSLRLGFLVVPLSMIDAVANVKSLMNRHMPLLEQAALCDFIVEGHFGRHLRQMREIYAERLSILQESARARLTGLLDISAVQAGLQTVGKLKNGVDATSAAAAAAERGVEVDPLSKYGSDLPDDALVLGFAAISQPDLRQGVRELGRVLERMAQRK